MFCPPLDSDIHVALTMTPPHCSNYVKTVLSNACEHGVYELFFSAGTKLFVPNHLGIKGTLSLAMSKNLQVSCTSQLVEQPL